MKAIQSATDGTLSWEQTPTPEPQPGEVRIRISATAVNRADLMQRAGKYPPPPGASPILGLECSGVVDALGEGASMWNLGAEVCALLAGGGYAEYVCVPEGQVLPVPTGLPVIKAAGIPEVFCTAFLNLFGEGGLKPHQKVLIHAGASGVGTAAIQLCYISENPCWVTVGHAEKIARCVALGAAGGTNRHWGSFVEDVREWTGREGVDLILCPVGADYLSHNQQVLAIEGRLVLIGLLGGRKTELDLGRLLVKRQRVIGSTLRARSVESKSALCQRMRVAIWPMFETGELTPVIDRIVSISEVDAAHEAMEANENIGKIVMTIP